LKAVSFGVDFQPLFVPPLALIDVKARAAAVHETLQRLDRAPLFPAELRAIEDDDVYIRG